MLNKVQLIGRLGKDPETRTIREDRKVTNFSLATWDRYKDNQGEWKEITEWHQCVIWGKNAETAGKFLHKGDLIYFEGKKQTQTYDDKNGETKYVVEIVGTFQFLPKQSGENKGPAPSAPSTSGEAPAANVDFSEDSMTNRKQQSESSDQQPETAGDDLPF
jgi:single-strand DNA-binding protein